MRGVQVIIYEVLKQCLNNYFQFFIPSPPLSPPHPLTVSTAESDGRKSVEEDQGLDDDSDATRLDSDATRLDSDIIFVSSPRPLSTDSNVTIPLFSSPPRPPSTDSDVAITYSPRPQQTDTTDSDATESLPDP